MLLNSHPKRIDNLYSLHTLSILLFAFLIFKICISCFLNFAFPWLLMKLNIFSCLLATSICFSIKCYPILCPFSIFLPLLVIGIVYTLWLIACHICGKYVRGEILNSLWFISYLPWLTLCIFVVLGLQLEGHSSHWCVTDSNVIPFPCYFAIILEIQKVLNLEQVWEVKQNFSTKAVILR